VGHQFEFQAGLTVSRPVLLCSHAKKESKETRKETQQKENCAEA
jgi:hypothetical protein